MTKDAVINAEIQQMILKEKKMELGKAGMELVAKNLKMEKSDFNLSSGMKFNV